MELYRFLQQQGFGSRKECRQLVEYGLVSINGCEADDYRQDVCAQDIQHLLVQGEPWQVLTGEAYIMLNKPAGYETSHKPMHNPSVFSLLPLPFSRLNIQAVGRLDVETTGLLLFSTDGQFVHALTSPKRHVPKLYQATLKHAADQSLVDRLLAGVLLKDENETLAADSAWLDDPCTLQMSISQGKYHQVRRMVAAAGNRVEQLHRLAVGELTLDNLEGGQWRFLSVAECALLGWGQPIG